MDSGASDHAVATRLDRNHVLARAEDHAADGDHALLIERLTDHRKGFVGVVFFLGRDEVRRVEVKLKDSSIANAAHIGPSSTCRRWFAREGEIFPWR